MNDRDSVCGSVCVWERERESRNSMLPAWLDYNDDDDDDNDDVVGSCFGCKNSF